MAINLKEIQKVEWFAVKSDGTLFKKGVTKTIKGARNGKDKADRAYGANLNGKAVVYFTDGSSERRPLF